MSLSRSGVRPILYWLILARDQRLPTQSPLVSTHTQAHPSAARSLWLSRRCTSWAASALLWRASALSPHPLSATPPAPQIRMGLTYIGLGVALALHI